ncbi:PilT/PilU family type 4a pilus ATPase [Paraferrimonas sp. SM1919]|uniref:PilT/PilU family type 4a pilus ATPase n=1 Tax=Paraferrimonas sp. SM1919 TaxID=2662263 RepID=UPI0013D6656F|nr:PilT/PilU family type 4a pilus ATPase [Paraferrimonas sp. SM1919]
MQFSDILQKMIDKKAADLFITSGLPISAKIDGEIQPLTQQALSDEQALLLVKSLMNEDQQQLFSQTKEANFALNHQLGRFRVSAMWQRETAAAVLRRIETQIPDMDKLGLPDILKTVVMNKRGLVILVGGTGTGKSTTLAAMIGHRNQSSKGHILTIEDPVEFVHPHVNCVVSQREVGVDTESFDAALKSALRQAPDVILIGEIRSQQTMEFAMTFAETGHLCLATLHANNANQALDRILHLMPKERQAQVLFDLSLNLKGIIAQQLIKKESGGRVVALEILLNTPGVSSAIAQGELHVLKETMAKSTQDGMQTFDQALFNLAIAGDITQAQALAHADSANDLRLRFKLEGSHHCDDDDMRGVTVDFS